MQERYDGEDPARLPQPPGKMDNPLVEDGRESVAALTGNKALTYPMISWHSAIVRTALREGHATDLGLEAIKSEDSEEEIEAITKRLAVGAIKTRAHKLIEELFSDRDFSHMPKELDYRLQEIKLAIKMGVTYEELGITEEILDTTIPIWNWNKLEPLDYLRTLRLPSVITEDYEAELISGIKDCIVTLSCDLDADTVYALLGTSRKELDNIIPWFHARRRALKAIEIFRQRGADEQFVLNDLTSGGLGYVTYSHLFTYIHHAHEKLGISYIDLCTSEEEVRHFDSSSLKYDFTHE